MGHTDDQQGAAPAGGLDRRRFLRDAGVAGLAVTTPALLAACGSSSGSGGSTGATSTSKIIKPSANTNGNPATPSPGGTLRVGMLGNGTGETYNPALINTPIDTVHGYSVFDPLLRLGNNYTYGPGLALSFTPSASATEWEIRLREGVTWHDGKKFTADDVIYSMRQMGRPTSLANFSVQNIRLNDLQKSGDYIVKVPLKTPDASLTDFFQGPNNSLMIQDGATDFTKPIGTGPYKLRSFTPGQQSSLDANRDYWDSPRPYPDHLEVISINNDQARLNALTGGQIDICSPVAAVQARAQLASPSSAWKLLVGAPGLYQVFVMRVDQPPFTDNRVRMALKLIADRTALIEATLSGFGVIGNDLLGRGLPFYDTSLPQRQQDIEQAKSLLKAAGQSDLRLTLQTAAASSSMIPAATVFAQQAAAAGVTVHLQRESPGSYFNPQLLWTKMHFAQDFWSFNALSVFYLQALVTGGISNETHWENPAFDKLVHKAIQSPEKAVQQSTWNQIQQIQYQQGGYIMWAQQQSTDAISPKVAGIGGAGSGWLTPPDNTRVWNWGLSA